MLELLLSPSVPLPVAKTPSRHVTTKPPLLNPMMVGAIWVFAVSVLTRNSVPCFSIVFIQAPFEVSFQARNRWLTPATLHLMSTDTLHALSAASPRIVALLHPGHRFMRASG